MHFGIDYGSKLAGTTVITYNVEGRLHQTSSAKKEDADAMILRATMEYKPKAIYLDAPLSLPNAYFGKGQDYFYREADKVLKAMSPMFLGGLTARAIQLKVQIEKLGVEVFETYPGALVRSLPELKACYNKKDKTSTPAILNQIKKLIGETSLMDNLKNYHEIDSILAWYSGTRHQNGNASIIGNKKEGTIIY